MAQPIIERGVLDLSDYDFENSEPIPLSGEWQFFWNELLEPGAPISTIPELVPMPQLWTNNDAYPSFGFATYRLKILLPDNYPELAVHMPDVYTSYALYVNDELISENGKVGTTKEEFSPFWLPLTESIGPFDKQEIDITLHIANFEHRKGGIKDPLILGSSEQLKKNHQTELGYDFLLTGSLIMAALFFFALFFFGRDDKTILYFSLYCLVYSYRVVGTDSYSIHFLFTDLPWLLTVKIEYLALYLSCIFFGLYVKHLYPEDGIKYVIDAFTAVFSIFSLGSLLLPAIYFTSTINLFFVILCFYVLYVSFVMVKATINKRPGSNFAFSSVILLLFIFVVDSLDYFVVMEEKLVISFISYIAFFFLQSLTLSYQFSNTLKVAKEEAESASIAKTHFLSTMGHELRTPLNAVIGFSELLLESKSNTEKTDYAKTIKKSGENLLSIINNILDFTKLESSDIELDYAPTHIPTMLAETVKVLGSLTDPKKVKLSFRFDDSLSDYIETDEARLKQILINLIGNAIKFTDQGEISVQVTTTESISEKNQILFIVKDTGIGVPENKMSLLFDRFSQINADRNRKYGGTGLGLAISKRLIEGLGGRIWVQSKVGVGTTFYFTITPRPVSKKILTELKAQETKAILEQPREDISILVVEDNPINQKVAQKVLERLGFNSDLASNGFEAVEKVQEKQYNLVLMDMEMPEMDGIEATEHIIKLGDKAWNPLIIAITANVSAEDRVRCFEAGMRDFISKPITLSSMETTLTKWFPSSVNQEVNPSN
ncbi:MAG: response regulator [Balneola sp.]|nr:MAG: response regulator [Balneola sp.]